MLAFRPFHSTASMVSSQSLLGSLRAAMRSNAMGQFRRDGFSQSSFLSMHSNKSNSGSSITGSTGGRASTRRRTAKSTATSTTIKRKSKRADLRYHAAKFPPPNFFGRPPTGTAAPLARQFHTITAAYHRGQTAMLSAQDMVIEEDIAPARKEATSSTVVPALQDKRIVFIGSGKMAEAIMGGIVNSGRVESQQVTACDPNSKRRSYLKTQFGINTTSSNAEAAEYADILLLAVKPQTMALVFEDIRGRVRKDCLIVSIAAGFTMSQIREGLGTECIVRAMPNTPALINESITSWTFTKVVSNDQRRQAKALLQSFGEEVLLSDERQLDMATALSGSGPAMCQLMFEAMIDSGVHMGFPRDVSRKLVLQTVRGAVNLAIQSGEHPSMLKNDITSPGGTTAAALYQLERGGMRTVVSDAVWAAYRRSRELGGLDSNIGPGRYQVSSQLELPEELVENLQQATEAMSAVKDEIEDLKKDL
eukprot:gene833-7893_t